MLDENPSSSLIANHIITINKLDFQKTINIKEIITYLIEASLKIKINILFIITNIFQTISDLVVIANAYIAKIYP